MKKTLSLLLLLSLFSCDYQLHRELRKEAEQVQAFFGEDSHWEVTSIQMADTLINNYGSFHFYNFWEDYAAMDLTFTLNGEEEALTNVSVFWNQENEWVRQVSMYLDIDTEKFIRFQGPIYKEGTKIVVEHDDMPSYRMLLTPKN
ncbi:hypothetical protein [Algivirga pacifica]